MNTTTKPTLTLENIETQANPARALEIAAHLAVIEAQLETLALQLETDTPLVPDELMSETARNTHEALRYVARAINGSMAGARGKGN